LNMTISPSVLPDVILKRGILTCVGLFLVFVGSLVEASELDKEIVLRGHVICVDDSNSEVSCGDENHRFALEVADGRRFLFDPGDPNSKIFEDERLHQRELQVKAWRQDRDQLEIIKIYSIKNDQLFDIYYFCRTCNIKAFVGGLCWCCQEEFEFRETPVSESDL